MVMVFTDIQMAISMKEIGRMISSKEMVSFVFQMVQYIKASFHKVNLMEKEFITTNQCSMMI